LDLEQAMNIQAFTTSQGSLIAPFILKKVVQRIKRGHDYNDIIREELMDIVDYSSEAEEIYDYCSEINSSEINSNEPANN
jgi:hypothetical protein